MDIGDGPLGFSLERALQSLKVFSYLRDPQWAFPDSMVEGVEYVQEFSPSF